MMRSRGAEGGGEMERAPGCVSVCRLYEYDGGAISVVGLQSLSPCIMDLVDLQEIYGNM